MYISKDKICVCLLHEDPTDNEQASNIIFFATADDLILPTPIAIRFLADDA